MQNNDSARAQIQQSRSLEEKLNLNKDSTQNLANTQVNTRVNNSIKGSDSKKANQSTLKLHSGVICIDVNL